MHRLGLSLVLSLLLCSLVGAQVRPDMAPPPPVGFVHLQQPINPRHPQAVGLQNWWRVLRGRAGGPTWYDLANHHHGTLTNMTAAGTSGWGGTTRSGGSGELRFDGVDDRVVPTCGCVANLTAFTVTAWFSSSNASTRQYLYQERNNSTAAQLALGLNEDFSGDLNVFNLDDSSGGWSVSSTSLTPTDGRWHQIAAVQSSKSAAAVYLDGVLVGTASTTTGTVTVQSRAIGARGDGTAPYAGSIDDVRIYTRALSASEVLQVYRESRQGDPTLLQRFMPTAIPSPSVAKRGSFMPFFSPMGDRK